MKLSSAAPEKEERRRKQRRRVAQKSQRRGGKGGPESATLSLFRKSVVLCPPPKMMGKNQNENTVSGGRWNRGNKGTTPDLQKKQRKKGLKKDEGTMKGKVEERQKGGGSILAGGQRW